jgi:hypothetical protein
MYLRFGWVVGNVGLLGTLIIVTLAISLTFLTSLSLALIATGQKMKRKSVLYDKPLLRDRVERCYWHHLIFCTSPLNKRK